MREIELETIDRWLFAPSPQETENLASKSHETRRIPDPYIFVVDRGKLKTPEGALVEKSVLKGNTIYDAEYDALMQIQDWADKNDSGLSLWFSPPYPGGYSSLKIVASEILYATSGTKILFNRAVVIDTDSITSLNIANSISDKKFTDSEELRGSPIFTNRKKEWLNILGRYSTQTDQIKSSEDLLIKEDTLRQINIIYSSSRLIKMNPSEMNFYAEREAQSHGLIGEKADSCAVGAKSAFNTFFGNALIEGPLGSFPCPRCSGPIPAGLGITTCPHCGLTKEEAGSTCG